MDKALDTTTPSATDWSHGIVRRMFQLMHHVERDNFDHIRFRGLSPNAFFYEDHARYFSFFIDNAKPFFRARSLLFDDASRELFDLLILFRILGHTHVRLPFNTPEALAYGSITEQWKIREAAETGLLGPLAVFSVPLDGTDVKVKCWDVNVATTFLFRQYYFQRDASTIEPARGDHVIDAGGCFGDSALGFAMAVGAEGRVYSFDPLRKHCEIMRENFAMNPALAERISVIEVGLSDENNPGSQTHARDAIIDPGARVAPGGDLETKTIDSLVDEGALPRVDFVKMDIEGSELAALRGGERALRKWRPKLAISLYHRPEDYFAIPLWLDALGLGYRFFLDHYSIHGEETVLYARVPAP